jgi:hypothetical protein
MGLIANRRDYDCEENRMLDNLTEYLNSINFAGERKWYGEATNFGEQEINGKKYYSAVLKKYTKHRDWVINEGDFIDIPLEVGNMFLRTHKIKEIKRKRINKR